RLLRDRPRLAARRLVEQRGLERRVGILLGEALEPLVIGDVVGEARGRIGAAGMKSEAGDERAREDERAAAAERACRNTLLDGDEHLAGGEAAGQVEAARAGELDVAGFVGALGVEQ